LFGVVRIEQFTPPSISPILEYSLIPEVDINYTVVQNKLFKMKAYYSCTPVVTRWLRHQTY